MKTQLDEVQHENQDLKGRMAEIEREIASLKLSKATREPLGQDASTSLSLPGTQGQGTQGTVSEGRDKLCRMWGWMG